MDTKPKSLIVNRPINIMSLVNLFHCSLYGFEHTLSTQEHAGVQIIIPCQHLHRAVEQDLHPQLTIATQVCGTGSIVVSMGFKCLPSVSIRQPFGRGESSCWYAFKDVQTEAW